MWIYTKNAFLSIVADRHDPSNLYVRGRMRGDIERVFPEAVVKATPTEADYAFRSSIPRHVVMGAVANSLLEIEYENFKSAVKEPDRHNTYLECWQAMNRLQVKRQRQEIIEVSSLRKLPRPKRDKPVAPGSIDGWPLTVRKEPVHTRQPDPKAIEFDRFNPGSGNGL